MSDAANTPDSHDTGSSDGGAGDEPAAGQASKEAGAGKPPPAKPTAPSGPAAVQLALEAGWTMAVLYGRIESVPRGKLLGLPTANELEAADRRKLELGRLRHLLKSLAQMPEFSESGLADMVPGDFQARPEALEELNFNILCALAADQSQAQLAYELGRSLRDTANPPDKHPPGQRQPDEHPPGQRQPDEHPPGQRQPDEHPPGQRQPDEHPPGEHPPGEHPPATALSRQFARGRIATIQGWLAALSSELPPQAATVVSVSLGRWREFAAALASTPTAELKNDGATTAHGAMPGTPTAPAGNDGAATVPAAMPSTPAAPAGKHGAMTVDAAMSRYLLRQGDLWLMLLTGTRTTAGLLSPEGYVAAAELALRRSVVIIRRVLRHYWVALLIGVVALGVILYLAAHYTSGAAKVWTTIAAIAGSLGITARAIASTTARLAAEAERPVFAIAEEDVMAWAITSMPPLRLPSRRVRQLRDAGIAPTNSLGRV